MSKLVVSSSAIEDAFARDAEAAKDIGFTARALVQATLPHKRMPGVNSFARHNGRYTLSITAPDSLELPYGSIPRLGVAWLTREVLRRKSRTIPLGRNITGFMEDLDMDVTGGKKGSVKRLRTQLRSLFNCLFTISWDGPRSTHDKPYTLADEIHLWGAADDANPGQDGLFPSFVVVSEKFYKEIIDSPIPIDMNAIKALRRSPMALDIYMWLTYRASYLTKETKVPWEALAAQTGCKYGRLRAFREAYLIELENVSKVYPEMKFEVTPGELILKPSPPHVSLLS